MIMKKRLRFKLKKALIGSLFVLISLFGLTSFNIINSETVYAVPENTETQQEETRPVTESDIEAAGEADNGNSENAENTGNTGSTGNSDGDSCKDSLGALGWLVCPTTGKIAEAVDWLYEKIEDILVINPISTANGSPIYAIWKYLKGVTNIVFIIFLLVVIYSQVTGLGISNYGIKKALPKLIIAAVLVNLSFLICQIAVDASNIIGDSLRGVFTSISESALSGGGTAASHVSYAKMYTAIGSGAAVAIGAGVIAFETGAIWMLIPVVLGALVAVVSGLITIALRQAVVALLIMISPLAMVAYMLPNTEKWFTKWKDLLFKMLVFYPMFSLLFGASQLAGFAIIASANDGFGLLLGTAVQIFPLFFAWTLMKMSGTFLGAINAKLNSLAAGPLATNRAWAGSHRQLTRANRLGVDRPITPSLRLMQFVNKRKVAREAEISEKEALVKERGLAYRARRNYRGGNLDSTLSKRGEEAYATQAQLMEYKRITTRDKNNFNKGFAYRAKPGTATYKRLNALDMANVNASDMLKVEQFRGEKIEYENATGFHERMEKAINAHMDLENGFEIKDGVKTLRSNYKFHFDPDNIEKTEEMARYNAAKQIMEGNVQDVQFAAASAAQAYDTQKKIVETKMQKYFELAPPTKDVVYRLNELTVLSADALARGEKADASIDAIIPGLRILNQRGDTDLVKEQLDNLLNKDIGGGITLGTHASQALASFLMFEVKDNDPWLRRFGKYINLETANVFNENDRQVMDVTYDEYIRGYHDGEPVTAKSPNGRMYAKKGMKTLVEGTSLDNIERTALANLDDSLKQAYGFKKEHPDQDWDVEGYLRKREEVQTAFEPAFLSASLKWLSGSEQINSAVKFWTGYELKAKKNDRGEVIVDEYGDPEYELIKTWEDKKNGFAGHKDIMEAYFRRKTKDYFKDQTTGQILGMRTDYRDATMEHLLAEYLNNNPEEKEVYDSEKEEHDRKVAEVQTMYGDLPPEEAKKKRAADIKKLDSAFKKTKMELAGRQLRQILGETGKLEQIYRTRRSGAANNAKDWLRGWVGLDNENMMSKEVEYYAKKREELRDEERPSDVNEEDDAPARIYGADDQMRFENELEALYHDHQDVGVEAFYEMLREKISEWFGGNLSGVEIKFRKYYEDAIRTGQPIETYDLKTKLDDLLHDLNEYPDA